MKQISEKLLKQACQILQQQGELPAGMPIDVQVRLNKDRKKGDYASNLAFVLGKACKKNPQTLAQRLISVLPSSFCIEKVQIDKQGFINMYLKKEMFSHILASVLQEESNLGLATRYLLPDYDMEKKELIPVYKTWLRICSVREQFYQNGFYCTEMTGLANVHLLDAPEELALIYQIQYYLDRLQEFDKDRLMVFLINLTESVNQYFNVTTLFCEDAALLSVRFCLLKALTRILMNGLVILGDSTIEKNNG